MQLLKMNKRSLLKIDHLKHHPVVLILEINVAGSDPNPGNVKCQNPKAVATTQNQRNPVNEDLDPVNVSRKGDAPDPSQEITINLVNDDPDLVIVVEEKIGNVPDLEITTENLDPDLEIENNVPDLDPETEAENVQDQNQEIDQIVSVPDQNQEKGSDPDQETENDHVLETENGLDHVIGDVDQGLNQKNVVVINVIENVPIAQDQKIENRNSRRHHHLGQGNAIDVMILLLPILLLLHRLQVQTENKFWQTSMRVSYHSDPQLLFYMI